MKNNETMYSFMGDDHESPLQPKRERVAGQFANREDNTKPYDNTKGQPKHVKEAMTIEQPNRAYYEFQQLALGHNPIDAFGAMVNKKFGTLKAGFDFRETRDTYISFYKQELEQL